MNKGDMKHQLGQEQRGIIEIGDRFWKYLGIVIERSQGHKEFDGIGIDKGIKFKFEEKYNFSKEYCNRLSAEYWKNIWRKINRTEKRYKDMKENGWLYHCEASKIAHYDIISKTVRLIDYEEFKEAAEAIQSKEWINKVEMLNYPDSDGCDRKIQLYSKEHVDYYINYCLSIREFRYDKDNIWEVDLLDKQCELYIKRLDSLCNASSKISSLV